MSTYKTNQGWRYEFQRNGKRYSKSGFYKKSEAVAHMAKQKIAIQDMMRDDDAFFVDKESMQNLNDKYSQYLEHPFNTLPDLIELMFSDFGLPYSFRDLKKIALKKRGKKIPAKLRSLILKRDNHKCKLCGQGPPDVKLHVDHIVATNKGGLTEERNLRTLCNKCNVGKSDMPFFMTG